jgi:uncharacterized protein YoxC
MPELTDVMRRLDGIDKQLSSLNNLMVKLAEQQKDITHLREELIAIRKKVDEDTDFRIKTLETIHAGCQINQVDASIKRVWKYFWGIIILYIGTSLAWIINSRN